jgi:hypothetical protein
LPALLALAFFATVLRAAIFRFAIASSPEVWPRHAAAREPTPMFDNPRRGTRGRLEVADPKVANQSPDA